MEGMEGIADIMEGMEGMERSMAKNMPKKRKRSKVVAVRKRMEEKVILTFEILSEGVEEEL